MSEPMRRALCCTCGSLRTFRRARNHREENYWLGVRPVDLDWSRELGDLKCSQCNRVTNHALLHPEKDWAADHAELIQHIALGGNSGRVTDSTVTRVRELYRQNNFPKNPFVNHRWWKSDENEARTAGKQWFPALCGELVAVPEEARENGRDITTFEAPTHVTDPDRADHENFDPETGLWWTSDGQCVNCLRVRNTWLLEQRRKDVAALLIKIVAIIDEIDANVVEQLADLVSAAIPGGGE